MFYLLLFKRKSYIIRLITFPFMFSLEKFPKCALRVKKLFTKLSLKINVISIFVSICFYKKFFCVFSSLTIRKTLTINVNIKNEC